MHLPARRALGLLPGDHGARGMRHDLLALAIGELARECGEQRLRGFLPHALARQPFGQAADLDEGERIGHQPPARKRHLTREREQVAAELPGQAQRLVTAFARDRGMPQRQMHAAAQGHLEVDRVFLAAADAVEVAQKVRLRPLVEPGAQGADQLAQGRNRKEPEGPAPGQTPLVQPVKQHRHARRMHFAAARTRAPVGKIGMQLGHTPDARTLVLVHADAEHARKALFDQARRLALCLGVRQPGQGIGRQGLFGLGHRVALMRWRATRGYAPPRAPGYADPRESPAACAAARQRLRR